MRILMVTAEYAPLAKAGGLADMVAGLAAEMHRAGHDVRVLLPDYHGTGSSLPEVGSLRVSPVRIGGTHPPVRLRHQPGHGPALYFVDCPPAFAHGGIYGGGEAEALRFALLSHAALMLCEATGFAPEVLHCHDWHTALAAALLRHGRHSATLADTRSLLTIHNIGYQGVWPATLLADLGAAALPAETGLHRPGEDHLNFLRAGITTADALSTVSPTHAREILTPEFGCGLDPLLRTRASVLTGILNGVDYREWDPATDPRLPARFSADDLSGRAECRRVLRERAGLVPRDVPVAGMVTRLAGQKGLQLVVDALPAFLSAHRLQFVVLGAGEPGYVRALSGMAAAFPGECSFLHAHDEELARLVYAGSDAFLVPSLYEPCGLAQMYALRYGAVPVVRQTGGLNDTITHFDPATGTGNGSVFMHADAGGLGWALEEILRWYANPADWRRLVANGMACDFSWTHQVPEYLALYRRMTGAA